MGRGQPDPGELGNQGCATAAPHTPIPAFYQPSLTAEYDEDSPGGDFDFFSNLVTKWEAAAKLAGDSTRQVVVRSGENQWPGGQISTSDPSFLIMGWEDQSS